jgi:hypothetical protein
MEQEATEGCQTSEASGGGLARLLLKCKMSKLLRALQEGGVSDVADLAGADVADLCLIDRVSKLQAKRIKTILQEELEENDSDASATEV